mmetsp:Transcript_7956/g.15505  ORF Transcript_7956/g.15505 Transcript_7956/m.15505 type:complete len:152 (-) Transcript_7956:117-572(-)
MEQDSGNSFQCTYADCSRSYATKTNLRRHVRINHLAMHTYTCHLCLKSLHSRQTMREHMNRHTGKKPFFCPEKSCGKHFKFSSQLSMHRKSHSKLAIDQPEAIEWKAPPSILFASHGDRLPGLSIERKQLIQLPLHPGLEPSGSLPSPLSF